MKGQRKLFILAGVMLVLEAASATVIPLQVAYVIDYLTVRVAQLRGQAVPPPLSPLAALGLPTLFNPDFDTLLIVTIGIVIATMINSLGDSLAEIYLAQGGQRLSYNMRLALHGHLQRLSLSFHTQKHTGDILSRVTSDIAAIEDFVISSLSDIAGSILLIVFILVTILIKSWQVAIVTAVIIPIMALISNYYTQRIKAASKRRRTSEGELASATEEMLTSIKVIQTYGLGSYEQSVFAEQSQKAMDAALETARLQARFSWTVNVLGALSTAAVIWMAVLLIFHSLVLGSVGLLAAYIRYIDLMFKPTKRLIQEWNTFGKLYASAERINDIFNIVPAVQDMPDAVEAPHLIGQIEFRNVSFSYQANSSAASDGNDEPPKPTLKGLNFTIAPGEVLAIVGYTGAGKSTIVQLLPRLYDPTDGQVLFDGKDIRSYTLESLRAQISMVLQETILFSGSVVENIAYGRPDATGAEIITAAKQANAHEFIDKMPQGYFTLLGERGANLSGGQRQRIAIARAFIRNTPILILDEPSTGLDAESTSLILTALKNLMKDKTTVIISHDLNLIRDADKILVIKDGQIIQSGTHESLLESGGLYADLYTKQYGQTPQIEVATVKDSQTLVEFKDTTSILVQKHV
jgi:ABC-type multidrug transport system fused ATPase/permease subunit